MDLDVRAIDSSELTAFVRADAAGFAEDADEFEKNQGAWVADELDRTRAAFADDAIIGTSRNYTFELTVPGGRQVAAGGVSAVAVLPTHRRRGVLRSMMTALLDESIARGESVSMLTASEGGIYRRFGYGVTMQALSLEVDTRAATFLDERPAGRARLVDPETLREHGIPLFDEVRRHAPGAITRPASWWTDVQFDRHTKDPRFDVLWENPDGEVDGFVTYAVKARWGRNPEHAVTVKDLVARTPEATRALWRYLCEIDLVATVKDEATQVDAVLPWMLDSARAAHATSIDDYVWTRLLDVTVALGARTYPAAGRLVLEVHDPLYPGGGADGVFAVEGGPDGATVARATDNPDLVCDVATLSAAWLGGVRWSTLAAAGHVHERTPGALARADAMFASSPLPYPYTWF